MIVEETTYKSYLQVCMDVELRARYITIGWNILVLGCQVCCYRSRSYKALLLSEAMATSTNLIKLWK